MKKLNVFIIILCALLSVLVLVMASLIMIDVFVEDGVLLTEDINDYGKEGFPLALVFPTELPENAQVVDFFYYDYWHEEKDLYLEIKFDSPSQMQAYLEGMIESCLQRLADVNMPERCKRLVEEQNPYDADYTDIFCTLYFVDYMNIDQTGYRVEREDSKGLYFSCHFALISYSFEDLTVIHTFVDGSYVNSMQGHTPKYFERFNVPLDKNLDRRIFLED